MTDHDIPADQLFPGTGDSVLDSMSFLSEVAERHPGAVSFAAGRPYEGYFDPESIPRHIETYRRYLRDTAGLDDTVVRQRLMQYGSTKGIAREVLAEHLLRDEGIDADVDAIVTTVGCQEAMYITARALHSRPEDVLLAVSPTYSGFLGAAALAGIRVLPVADSPDGMDLDDLSRTVRSARAAGLRPRALYVVPDFANPSGMSLDERTRSHLLALAGELDLLIVEDSPYRLIGGEGRRASLKARDTERRVLHLGSFAKTVFPGVRVGYCVADQRTDDGGVLADRLARIKSMVTVNTSPVTQAIVAGCLLEHDFSLESANTRETAAYRRNLTHLLEGLTARFGPDAHEEHGVSWNVPTGGFFAVLTTDFTVDDALLEHSADRYGVLWTPMHHFFHGGPQPSGMRLSCSSLSPAEIDTGLDRLAAMVAGVRAGCRGGDR
ncbi:aminotransferase-like domain-containing protein [Streptomyces sp. NBC_01217]|uniref:aminotransferase-like domain-containing protein n=1 Tax=Streptomyces sp. NBC_01217 TaxID=2903779 RepID=UPI002E108165|nr:PLP-dependent aminotransferase family protein [Streptomyces sp. NBC_01217]